VQRFFAVEGEIDGVTLVTQAIRNGARQGGMIFGHE
jgi:hypothetical protein